MRKKKKDKHKHKHKRKKRKNNQKIKQKTKKTKRISKKTRKHKKSKKEKPSKSGKTRKDQKTKQLSNSEEQLKDQEIKSESEIDYGQNSDDEILKCVSDSREPRRRFRVPSHLEPDWRPKSHFGNGNPTVDRIELEEKDPTPEIVILGKSSQEEKKIINTETNTITEKIGENSERSQQKSANSENDLFMTDSSKNSSILKSSVTPKKSHNDSGNDEELYYKPLIGETMNDKYKVVGILGKGVYSKVLKVEYLGKFYALKVIRKAEQLRESGMREIEILFILNQENQPKKQFILNIFDSFDHKGFLCLVLELMGLNLRDMLDSQRKGKNFSLAEIRLHAWQMLQALRLLKSNSIVHLDIKPDNILYDSDKNVCKLSDFGTSMEVEEVESGKEYVSRYYRAPEVFLGGTLDFGVDLWSMGCTFYEMFTGEFLFPGNNEAHMIDLFLVTKGIISTKYLKKCKVSFQI